MGEPVLERLRSLLRLLAGAAKPSTVAMLAVTVAVLAGMGPVSVASAASTGPNLNGIWDWNPINTQFEIASGTSTDVRGWIDSANATNRAALINAGSIVNGQGWLSAYDDLGINRGYVITSVVGNTMTGFSYWSSFGATPSPPPDIGTCQTLQMSDPGYACRAFTAVRLNPPVQSGLTVAISPTVPPGGLAVGATLSIPVTVTATGGAVTKASLGDGLTVGGDGAVKVMGPADGAGDFSLAKDQSRTFTYTVTGAKPGTAVLNATASGTGVDGSPVSQSATTSFPVVQQALQITMATTPGTVTLKADERGKLAPKTITVRLKASNVSKARLSNVQLLSLSPVPADRTQQLDQLAFDRKLFPLKFGNIEAGANKVKTFTLKVTGDGTYVIDALALFDDPAQSGGNGRASAEGGKFTVAAPLLYFTASNRHNFVVDGDSWYVTGHVKNMSSFQTLCMLPLYPDYAANAGGLGPHDIRIAPTPDVPAPPLSGPVKPGETIPFLMRVETEIDGPTRSLVTLKPAAVRGDPGEACRIVDAQKRPRLKSTEVKLAKDSTQFQIRVDKYRNKLSTGPGALEFFGAYAQSAYKVLAHLYESSLSLARAYGSVDKVVAALGNGSSVVLSQLYKSAAFASWFYTQSTEDERRQFFDQVKADFQQKTGQVWDGLQTSIQQSVGTFLEKVSDAYISGDWQALFHVLGEGAGTGLTESAIQMAEWELAIGVVKQTGAVGRTINRYRVQSGVLSSLQSVPVGRILTFGEMQRLWGLALEDYNAFKKIAEEEGVLIGVRSRSPISVQNLEDGAVWKHEELKPKNVSQIDIDYLGFEPTDRGLVALRTYSPAEQQAIRARIAKAPLGKAERAAVEARLETRLGEHEFVPKIEGLAEKRQIDVGFNYADNGLDLDATSNVRSFALERRKVEGGTYYRPLQENPKFASLANGTEKLPRWCQRLLEKVLCRVSGDMDGVYLTRVDGRQLGIAKRIRVYKKLMEAGWQHPETLTWIKKGLFDFESKSKILRGLELGGEALMEFGADGKVRATYLKLKNSHLNNINDYFVAVLGGYTSFAKTVSAR